MRTLVTGGTGTLGRELVPLLVAAGHDVSVLTRRADAALPVGAAVRVGDVTTGAGLEGAVGGVEFVVHGATNPTRARRVDVEGTRRLLDACRAVGVAHILYVSIVGVDRHPLSYYRAKLAAEALVEGSSEPWTIVRAAQFHELIDRVLRVAMRSPLKVAPDWRVQPIAAAEVAAQLVQLVDDGPSGHVPHVAGPEVRDTVSLAQAWCAARGVDGAVRTLRIPGKVSATFRAGWTTAPDHAVGTVTWEQWLRH